MRPIVRVGLASCGRSAGAQAVMAAVRREVEARELDVRVAETGCLGLCHEEVLVEVERDGDRRVFGRVEPRQVPAVLRAGLSGEPDPAPIHAPGRGVVHPMLKDQVRVALRHAGRIDPTCIDDFLAVGGFSALVRALRAPPSEVVETIRRSGLRGRGGGGFPTGEKWARVAATSSDERFVVVNADEGDPGAFMDRNLIESDPFSVLEGMIIAGRAVGARQGFVYVRHEYPLAVERLTAAVEAARQAGFLGRDILGSGFSFEVRLRRGAGAFVCGEETALMASIEGRRGMPTVRPPYPAEEGLYGRPTLINNVETFAAVPWIVEQGPERFRALGTEGSAGTKIFCLAGDVRRGGMVEVPMGTSLRTLIEDLGGGTESGRPIKAVQIGGPSGGCLPAAALDIPIDYDALRATGAMMGSGGIVVLDDRRCMVDLARYFTRFMADESCGKCTPCRDGTPRLAQTLDRLADGRGRSADLDELRRFGDFVAAASMCGLGRSAPNPVSTTLRYFPEEYQAHVEGRCPSGTCRALVRYVIGNADCDGCQSCQRVCPSDAIFTRPGALSPTVDDARCLRCDACRQVCPIDIIEVVA